MLPFHFLFLSFLINKLFIITFHTINKHIICMNSAHIMQVSLHHLLILLLSLRHSLVCAKFHWNPAYPATYEEMSRSDNVKASLSLSFSCLFIFFLLFLFHKLRERFFPLPTTTTEAIKSCPTFEFSEMKELRVGNGAEECAVCLVEFQDSDTVKMLPLCQHVFHQLCIDQWLASRLTCPICRQNLVTPHTQLNITDVPSPEQQQEQEEEQGEDESEGGGGVGQVSATVTDS